MLVSYILDMPNVGSWNGKWTGEGNLYAVVKSYRSKAGIEKAKDICEKGSYYYGWSDGWGASISVKEIDAREARQLRKKSKGFCGYNWMIKEIETYGRIRTEKERYAKEK